MGTIARSPMEQALVTFSKGLAASSGASALGLFLVADSLKGLSVDLRGTKWLGFIFSVWMGMAFLFGGIAALALAVVHVVRADEDLKKRANG